MPTTARKHFEDDLSRAYALAAAAVRLETTDPGLARDVGRAGIAFGIGAMDAYLCDAYVDCLARCLKALRRGTLSTLPDGYKREVLPIGPLLAKQYSVRLNWSLRMAARARMERENLLQVSKVRDLFNPVLPTGQKLWHDLALQYAAVGRKRLTKYRLADLRGMTPAARGRATKAIPGALLTRIGSIVQRRHDIVHNVDRPKTSPQNLTLRQVSAMLDDVRDFVRILDDHLHAHRIC